MARNKAAGVTFAVSNGLATKRPRIESKVVLPQRFSGERMASLGLIWVASRAWVWSTHSATAIASPCRRSVATASPT